MKFIQSTGPNQIVKRKARILIVLTTLLQVACTTVKLSDFETAEATATSQNTVLKSVSSFNDMPLRSGQIVVSEAGSSMSFMMNLMASEYAAYGHAGILSREQDGFYVYEAFGFLNLQLWKPPTRRLHGKIRRVPLLDFLGRGTVAAIYEHPSVDLQAVAAYAQKGYKDKLAFDGVFDLRTSNSVYCSEFVARALEAGGHEPLPVTARTRNPSLLRTMNWLELDAPGYLLAGHLIRDADHIARFSRRYTSAQLSAHFSFEQELHNRFEPDQTLGNIFRWTSAGPRYRKHLAKLRSELIQKAALVDETDIERWTVEQMNAVLRGRVNLENARLSQIH